jgi:hypothetical protein
MNATETTCRTSPATSPSSIRTNADAIDQARTAHNLSRVHLILYRQDSCPNHAPTLSFIPASHHRRADALSLAMSYKDFLKLPGEP